MTGIPDSRAVIFGCAGQTLSPQERKFFESAQPWAFILFSRNLDHPAQIRALCDDLRASVGWHAPILIDQEGGRVERLGHPHWHSFTPPLDDAARAGSERLFWLRGRMIADDLLSAGINVNCAPLCDVAVAETHPFLKNRCYGLTADDVTRNAVAMAAGQAAGGVASVIKHLPGHGRGLVDSHLELPKVTASLESLTQDFAPFRALANQTLGMTGHMVVEALDPSRSATQSKTVIDFIRSDIGFDGLLMTDDISMQALKGDVVERSLAALAAGCDVSLHCNGDMVEMQALAKALPPLQDGARMRAERAVQAIADPLPVDISALAAERDAMLGQAT